MVEQEKSEAWGQEKALIRTPSSTLQQSRSGRVSIQDGTTNSNRILMIDPIEARRRFQKTRWRFLVILDICAFWCFVDRTNHHPPSPITHHPPPPMEKLEQDRKKRDSTLTRPWRTPSLVEDCSWLRYEWPKDRKGLRGDGVIRMKEMKKLEMGWKVVIEILKGKKDFKCSGKTRKRRTLPEITHSAYAKGD